MARLALPQVTLCAASSVNVAATLRALEASLAQVDFASCLFFTDAQVKPSHPGITIMPIAPLTSAAAYSDFLLTCMVDHVDTSHCMIVQWDGHVLDAGRWREEFLDFDYIGASWPQFSDGYDVGNGGFSMRSARLMALCRHASFVGFHPEDLSIGRENRFWLEEQGMRFAPRALADIFSAERAGDVTTSFGYHGIWHMPSAISVARFWEVYCALDDRSTVRHDFYVLLKHMARGSGGLSRALRMVADHVRAFPKR